jgi:arylsulfatase A-like enzyme
MTTLKIEGREYGAVPTDAPLLAKVDAALPERLSVRGDGREIPPLDAAKPGAEGWIWMKGEARASGNVYLNPGERFDASLLLPPGPAVIEISGYPTGPAGSERALRVEVNGRPAGEVRIGVEGVARIAGETVLGENAVSVIYPDATEGRPVRLSAVIVKSMADLVLVARPAGERAFAGDYRFEYAVLPDDVVDWMRSSLQMSPVFGTDAWLSLYALEHYALSDGGSGDNPFAIKKKIKHENNVTLNILMAPAPSRLSIPARIPDGAVLKFGIGVADRSGGSPGDTITFRVVFESGGKRGVLFLREVEPDRLAKDEAVSWQSVNLAKRSGERGRLILETEGTGAAPIPAFWANPHIVRAAPGPEAEGGRPNVILISIDTVRADHLGCYGYPLGTSPAMDALAAESALFLNARSHAPYTLSSHASILTGLLPTSHQVLQLDQSLDASAVTLADRFRAAGYLTAALVGGGQVSARYGLAKGFDVFDERAWVHKDNDLAGLHFGRVANWLKENRPSPFFLFVHTYQPHDPYDAPAPQGRMFLEADAPWRRGDLQLILGAGFQGLFMKMTPAETANLVGLYDGEIRYTDEALIGPLVALLRETGLYDRSMIVLTSDHGEKFDDHYGWVHGHTLYDEETRVPLMIKYPASRHRGERIAQSVRSVDLAPTLLEEAGIAYDASDVDGLSLRGLVEGREREGRPVLSYLPAGFIDDIPEKIALVRDGRKLILNKRYEAGAYTYFNPPPPPQDDVELFDLGADPGEKRNLAAADPASVRRLFDALRPFQARLAVAGKSKRFLMDEALREKLRTLGYVR